MLLETCTRQPAPSHTQEDAEDAGALASQDSKAVQMITAPTQLASTRAVIRWNLLVTLSHNPSLMAQRKHRLNQPDEILRWHTKLTRKLKQGAASVIQKKRQRAESSGTTTNPAYDDTAFPRESATNSPPSSSTSPTSPTSPGVIDVQPTVTEATESARHGPLSGANPFTGNAIGESSRGSESSA